MLKTERTKIVATLGPASSNREVLGGMVEAGLDVVRLNFSHGERADHVARFDLVRTVASELGHNLAVLVDLQGPKIRVGMVEDNGVKLDRGREVTLVAGIERCAEPDIPVVYPALAADVRKGDRILLDDGAIGLRVADVEGDRVRCEVERGGVVKSRKGVNLPGVAVSAPSLTAKDRADVATAVEFGADYVALSFVRKPEDVVEAKQAIAESGGDIPVVAKLERPEAIDRLDEILEVADAVMVARGDLGVELAVEEVPPIQKHIIARANSLGVPVITATQMLESMVSSSRPTRAEASDVANAIFDGTDAVMLSQETAIGQYPVESVATMRRIARAAESDPVPGGPAAAGGRRAGRAGHRLPGGRAGRRRPRGQRDRRLHRVGGDRPLRLPVPAPDPDHRPDHLRVGQAAHGPVLGGGDGQPAGRRHPGAEHDRRRRRADRPGGPGRPGRPHRGRGRQPRG